MVLKDFPFVGAILDDFTRMLYKNFKLKIDPDTVVSNQNYRHTKFQLFNPTGTYLHAFQKLKIGQKGYFVWKNVKVK
jgi:hypothetical protein